jgi:hypothetical protein
MTVRSAKELGIYFPIIGEFKSYRRITSNGGKASDEVFTKVLMGYSDVIRNWTYRVMGSRQRLNH